MNIPSSNRSNPFRIAGGLLLWILAIIFLVPLVAIAFLIAVVFSPIFLLWNWYWLRRFRRLNSGRCFLVWTRRNGWGPLLENNVLIALPADVEPIRAGNSRHELITAIKMRKSQPQRPYLVFVDQKQIHAHSLHALLLPYKSNRKIDPGLQNELRPILADIRDEMSRR